MDEGPTVLGRLLRWVLLVVAALVALKLAVWLIGAVVGLAFFVVFTVVPLAVVGWVVVQVFRAWRGDDAPDAA